MLACWREHDVGEFRALFLLSAKLYMAAEQQPGDDPVLAGNGRYLGARLLGFPRDRELLRVAEEASDGVGGRRRIADFRGCQAPFGS